MQHAAQEGHTAVVDLLLAAGASVNACPLSNATALYNAANGGHVDVVQRLVTTGADVDLRTSSGSTPLHAAANNGHTEVPPDCFPSLSASDSIQILFFKSDRLIEH